MARLEELYTVILTNYNNEKNIYTAIDSILNQKYNNIELIITDDCSDEFNKNKIKKYIDINKKNNIKKVDFVLNSKNIGTVKTLNKALKKSKGEYILFFASDDSLANEYVLKNFRTAFEKKRSNIITSQWKICDNELNVLSNFVSVYEAKKYNRKNIINQYFRLCCSNIYGSGSTSYRKNIFNKYGYINEDYKLLEDWPFWLHLVSSGEKIYFENFDSLLHRGGGISDTSLSKNNIFYFEILDTFKKQIIPNLDKFAYKKRIKILKSYKFHIVNYSDIIDTRIYMSDLMNKIKSNKKIQFYWYMDDIFPNIIEKIIILLKYNIVVPISVMISLVMNFFIVNKLNYSNNKILLIYIMVYLTIYYLVSISFSIHKTIRRKK